jgi:hypothetical protein
VPFLVSHFSPGDKIENCPAQFLAVCWIVHVEVKVHRLCNGFSVSNALSEISNAVDYAKFRSRSHDAVIRVYDDAGYVIETHEHTGEFKDW